MIRCLICFGYGFLLRAKFLLLDGLILKIGVVNRKGKAARQEKTKKTKKDS
jgi:hypothetical protein